MFIVTKVKEITEASASVGLLLGTAVVLTQSDLEIRAFCRTIKVPTSTVAE